jgi:hypothetical protein
MRTRPPWRACAPARGPTSASGTRRAAVLAPSRRSPGAPISPTTRSAGRSTRRRRRHEARPGTRHGRRVGPGRGDAGHRGGWRHCWAPRADTSCPRRARGRAARDSPTRTTRAARRATRGEFDSLDVILRSTRGAGASRWRAGRAARRRRLHAADSWRHRPARPRRRLGHFRPGSGSDCPTSSRRRMRRARVMLDTTTRSGVRR